MIDTEGALSRQGCIVATMLPSGRPSFASESSLSEPCLDSWLVQSFHVSFPPKRRRSCGAGGNDSTVSFRVLPSTSRVTSSRVRRAPTYSSLVSTIDLYLEREVGQFPLGQTEPTLPTMTLVRQHGLCLQLPACRSLPRTGGVSPNPTLGVHMNQCLRRTVRHRGTQRSKALGRAVRNVMIQRIAY